MNAAYLHLLVTHLAVAGYVIGSILLLATVVRSGDRGIFLAAVLVLLLAALGTGAAYFTGEPAEEIVEKLPNTPESLIETHEERAQVAVVIAGVATVVTCAVFLFTMPREGPISIRPLLLLLLVNLAVCVSMTWVGVSGGVINHPEIRHTSQQSAALVNN